MKKNTYVLIRSVTHTFIGRIVSITRSWIVVDHCAWVAESARWGAMVATGDMRAGNRTAEVEAYPEDLRVSLARGAIVEVVPWAHGTVKTQ